MKTKSIMELLTLSSTLYILARDTELLDRIKELSGKGKEGIDRIISETKFDENGDEIEFIDKIMLKTHELKDELHAKVEELVVKFYKKVNIAHIEEIKALHDTLEKTDRTIALLEARLNRLEEK